jgi:Fur family peroxide stress response transcriptional regulator
LILSKGIPVHKHSVKRDAILKVLKKTSAHPGAQWVHEQLKPSMPDLSLGTVYRNLRFFRKEGTALSLGVINGEERFDGITEPHPHLVCSHCGAVLDLSPSQAELFRGNLERLHSEEEGFSIDFRRTIFYGLCRDCGGTGRQSPLK